VAALGLVVIVVVIIMVVMFGMLLGVVLGGVLMVIVRMDRMAIGHVGVVSGGFVVAFLMRLVGLTVVLGGGFVMLGRFLVMMMLGHGNFLSVFGVEAT